jgi:hypothetical protein
MSLNVPTELCQQVCDEITDHSSLMQASLVSHSWRAYVLPRLFESITFNTMGGPWQESQFEIDQGLRSIIPLVRRVLIASLRQTSPRDVSDSDLQQISGTIAALPNLEAIMIHDVRFNTVNSLLQLVGLADGASRGLELSLVHAELTHATRPKTVPETDVISLSLCETSWRVLDSFFWFVSESSRIRLCQLKMTYGSRHNILLLYDELCDLTRSSHYHLLDLALEFRSLGRGTQLGKLNSNSRCYRTEY